MAIKNLTDGSQAGSGIPTILKLYKGTEKEERTKNGRTYEIMGKDLQHFRAEFEEPYAHLKDVWEGLYGTEPTEFNEVFLAAPTADDAFQSWKEEWNKSQTLLHRCDGETQVQWYSEAAKMQSTAAIKCAAPACQCKNTGRLKLIIPEFLDAAGVFGYVSVTTHSLNDILTVYRYLDDLQRIYGDLLRIPFVFGRAKKEVSAPKQVKQADGSLETEGRIKVTKSLFYIHVTEEFARNRLLPALYAPTLPALPAPAPVITSAEGAALLSPGKARRIDTGANTGKPTEPDPEPAHNVFEDEAKVEKLLNYAESKLDFDIDEVLHSLQVAVSYPVETLAYWRESEVMALGALIAGYCRWDKGAIEKFTSKGGYKIEHRDAALAVAEFVSRQEAELIP